MKKIRLANNVLPTAFASGLLVLALLVGFTLPLGAPDAPDFTEFAAGEERKQVFFKYMAPLVKAENEAILASREKLQRIQDAGSASWAERRWMNLLALRYEMDDFDAIDPSDRAELIERVDKVPASMALAQAANESAWGTSRFARLGNNYFGQWCFVQGCGLVPTARNSGASHEVAAFESARESVRRYMNNINTHSAYSGLRNRRALLRDEGSQISGPALAPTLIRYSERGQEYVDELQAMIRGNELQQYDL